MCVRVYNTHLRVTKYIRALDVPKLFISKFSLSWGCPAGGRERVEGLRFGRCVGCGRAGGNPHGAGWIGVSAEPKQGPEMGNPWGTHGEPMGNPWGTPSYQMLSGH